MLKYKLNKSDQIICMKYLMLFLLTSSSLFTFADDTSALYNEVLNRHLKYGHMPRAELYHQKRQLERNKEWQKEFHQQVRGVASTLNTPKNIIELDNPTIEIPVK